MSSPPLETKCIRGKSVVDKPFVFHHNKPGIYRFIFDLSKMSITDTVRISIVYTMRHGEAVYEEHELQGNQSVWDTGPLWAPHGATIRFVQTTGIPFPFEIDTLYTEA